MAQGREREGSVMIVIGGQVYEHFLSLNLKRSIREACCSGSVVLSWPGADAFNATQQAAPAFSAGAEGQIMLDDQLAASIIFDTRISKGTPKHYELTLQFRGPCSCFVDASPDHESGQENDKTPDQIIQTMMQGFKPSLQAEAQGEKIPRFIIAEGETIERAARRAAREQGMIGPWETPEGNWKIQDKMGGSGGGGSIELGRDFTQWSVKADIVPRFQKYGLSGNMIPDDDNYGKKAENVWDESQREMNFEAGKKLLRGLIDGHHTKQSLKKRGDLESNMRAGQGLNVTVKTATWTDQGGTLWKAGNKYHVKIGVDLVDDECVLEEVEFEITPDSRSATLVLTSENAWGGGGAESVLKPKSVLWDRPIETPPSPPPQGPQTPPPPRPPEQAPDPRYPPGIHRRV